MTVLGLFGGAVGGPEQSSGCVERALMYVDENCQTTQAEDKSVPVVTEGAYTCIKHLYDGYICVHALPEYILLLVISESV